MSYASRNRASDEVSPEAAISGVLRFHECLDPFARECCRVPLELDDGILAMARPNSVCPVSPSRTIEGSGRIRVEAAAPVSSIIGFRLLRPTTAVRIGLCRPHSFRLVLTIARVGHLDALRACGATEQVGLQIHYGLLMGAVGADVREGLDLHHQVARYQRQAAEFQRQAAEVLHLVCGGRCS